LMLLQNTSPFFYDLDHNEKEEYIRNALDLTQYLGNMNNST